MSPARAASARPSAARRAAAPPARLVVLVATRKGAWLFHGDARRRSWRADGPHFLGHTNSQLQLDLGFDDKLRALTATTEAASAAWKKAREGELREEAERLFREYVRTMDREAEGRTQAVASRKERLAELTQRAPLSMSRTLLANTYFWID